MAATKMNNNLQKWLFQSAG